MATYKIVNQDGSAPFQLSSLTGLAALLALLYFGRDVLIPVTLAVILSLLIAPLIRAIRRFGLGHTTSIVVAVALLLFSLGSVGLVLGAQVVRMGISLPQYESTMRAKLMMLDHLTLGRLDSVHGEADRVMRVIMADTTTVATQAASGVAGLTPPAAGTPIPVEVHHPPARPVQLVSRVLGTLASPLSTMGIVFVVLIFVLLEHEVLRDRFISLIGKNDLRATTLAVNDAGERLSRFFMSQLAVNVAVGALVGAGLAIIGLPHAFLWAALATILRFVPYVGVWMAAAIATLLAAAISPDWTLAILTLGLFAVIEIVVSQWVEPQLYGHTTGLSPLSVVIAAIFWGWIWGPVGLILSTPLTLCLVVAGRYVNALHVLEILLGEIPALTLPENLYQRALSGDAQEIVTGARAYVKRKSLAAYCDAVLLPALHLAHMDFADRAITRAEQHKVGNAMTAVVQALTEKRPRWCTSKGYTVIEGVNVGRQLRNERENRLRQLQAANGTSSVPVANQIVLAVGAGSVAEDIATEMLVRILHLQQVQGRHLSLDEIGADPVRDIDPWSVAMVCFVSMHGDQKRQHLQAVVTKVRKQLPHAQIWALFLENPFVPAHPEGASVIGADIAMGTYDETIQRCLQLVSPAEPQLETGIPAAA